MNSRPPARAAAAPAARAAHLQQPGFVSGARAAAAAAQPSVAEALGLDDPSSPADLEVADAGFEEDAGATLDVGGSAGAPSLTGAAAPAGGAASLRVGGSASLAATAVPAPAALPPHFLATFALLKREGLPFVIKPDGTIAVDPTATIATVAPSKKPAVVAASAAEDAGDSPAELPLLDPAGEGEYEGHATAWDTVCVVPGPGRSIWRQDLSVLAFPDLEGYKGSSVPKALGVASDYVARGAAISGQKLAGIAPLSADDPDRYKALPKLGASGPFELDYLTPAAAEAQTHAFGLLRAVRDLKNGYWGDDVNPDLVKFVEFQSYAAAGIAKLLVTRYTEVVLRGQGRDPILIDHVASSEYDSTAFLSGGLTGHDLLKEWDKATLAGATKGALKRAEKLAADGGSSQSTYRGSSATKGGKSYGSGGGGGSGAGGGRSSSAGYVAPGEEGASPYGGQGRGQGGGRSNNGGYGGGGGGSGGGGYGRGRGGPSGGGGGRGRGPGF